MRNILLKLIFSIRIIEYEFEKKKEKKNHFLNLL